MTDLTREFLETYGLYRKYHSSGIHFGKKSDILTPSLQLYCERCHGVRTFNESYINRVFVDGRRPPRARDLPPIDPGDDARNGRIVGLIFVCQECKEERIHYQILFGESEDESNDPLERGHAMKVGQYPAQSASLPQDLRHYLKQHEDIYRRGRMSELNGFGIGALAYYRRIVEKIIDSLLEDLTVVFADDEPKEKYREVLEQVRATRVHAKKIELVKDLVPDVLKRGQGNPLGFLHEALSVGLHSLDEGECLEIAAEIRETIAFLNKHIQLAREQAHQFSGNMARLEAKLKRMTDADS